MRVEIDICVLPDGCVVFGDLTPALREVADVIAGVRAAPETADAPPASNSTGSTVTEQGPSP